MKEMVAVFVASDLSIAIYGAVGDFQFGIIGCQKSSVRKLPIGANELESHPNTGA
jgi:hypothetical protein